MIRHILAFLLAVALAWLLMLSGCHPPCGPARDHPDTHKENR